jgi:hypothetical protein
VLGASEAREETWLAGTRTGKAMHVCGRPHESASDKLDHNEEVVFTRSASHGTSTVHADSWVYGGPPSRSAQSMLPTHNSYIATGPGSGSNRILLEFTFEFTKDYLGAKEHVCRISPCYPLR